MGDKSKHLCKWNKDSYEKDLPKLRRIVSNPRHVCVRCGRAAREKGRLCKPSKL